MECCHRGIEYDDAGKNKENNRWIGTGTFGKKTNRIYERRKLPEYIVDREANFFEKTPFYMTYPMQNLYEAEMEYEKDIERMKQWHPKQVQQIQKMVDERCDELEYEGSRLFDEEPDRNMMQLEALAIYQKLADHLPEEKIEAKKVEADTGKKVYFEAWEEPALEAACCDRGRHCDDWLCSIVEILFYNEAYRRRCRHRRCKRWW